MIVSSLHLKLTMYWFSDDWYEGMFIPKDSTLFVATWAIHHTEDLFADHDTFNPDRYRNHPKLANDYAGSPEWSNRDKLPLFPNPPRKIQNSSYFLISTNWFGCIYITTVTVPAGGSARASTSQSATCSESLPNSCGHMISPSPLIQTLAKSSLSTLTPIMRGFCKRHYLLR